MQIHVSTCRMISECHHGANELLSSLALFFPQNAQIRSLCEPLEGSFFSVCCVYVCVGGGEGEREGM